MKILKSHHKAFGYSMEDLKGIDPSLCTQLMEEGAKSAIEHQQTLRMKKLVRKVVLRLLDAGIFFLFLMIIGLVRFIVFLKREVSQLCQ
jgi:hypothetical protein